MRSGLAAGGVTPTQLALAWVLSRGDDVVPSPWDERAPLPRGESVAAVDVELTAADLERIEWGTLAFYARSRRSRSAAR